MNRPAESPLVRRIWDLPIPAAERARAVREFERAERVVDDAAELVGGLRQRVRGAASGRIGRRLAATSR